MRTKFSISLLAVVITLCAALTSYAQLCPNEPTSGSSYSPWPKFHFDNRNTGKTSNFGTQVGKLKWKFITGAPVTSSPVVHCTVEDTCYDSCLGSADSTSDEVCYKQCQDCTVYVGSADNYFYAIDAETGQLEWQYQTEAAIELASAAIDNDNILYFGSNDGYFYAFDLDTVDKENPEPSWIFNTRNNSLGKGTSSDTKPNAAISSSPAIDTDNTIVFASNNGYLYALNPSGAIKWTREITSSWASPAIDTDLDRIYIGSWFGDVDLSSYSFSANCDNGTEDTLYTVFTGHGYENFWILDSADGTDTFSTVSAASYFSALDNDERCEWLDANPTLVYNDRFAVPGFNCIPGGIISSAAIGPSGNILLGWLTTYAEWPTWCSDDASNNNLWMINRDGSYVWTIANEDPMYSTPAVIEDGSFFAVSGENVMRGLPDSLDYYTVATIGDRSECSPAVDGVKNVFLGSNGGFFYAICADCPEDPMLWQYPAETAGPLRNDDNQTASIISSPAIGDDTRHSVYVGASDGNVYAFYDGARIYGQVLLSDSDNGTTTKEPLRGVKLTLTSTFVSGTRVTYSDPDGNFEFSGVENVSYNLVPEKLGYVFTPATKTALISNDQDAEVTFVATDGFTISGTVTDSSEAAMAGISVILTSENFDTESTVTDSSGNYSFSGLSYDTYTITPSLDGYGFQPASQTVTISAADAGDKTGNDFVGSSGYQISGTVIDFATQKALSNITITLTGTVAATSQFVTESTTTDENGSYSFVSLESGTYTVTASSLLYEFEPTSEEVIIASSNIDSVNFVAASGISISGKILLESSDNSSAITNVTVNLYEDTARGALAEDPYTTATPDASGNFFFIGIPAGTYVIKPSYAGYGFEPLSEKVTVISSDITDITFTATKGFYITGKVINAIGAGMRGVEVFLQDSSSADSASAVSTLTSDDGTFSFTGLASGSYTVQLNTDFYRSLPVARSVELYTQSKEGINFIASSTCTLAISAIPPVGGEGTLVNIYGVNFGWYEPLDNETVNVSSDDGSATLPAGVYFGDTDPNTWTPAKKIISWSNFKVVVEAPGGAGYFKVYVARVSRGDEGCYGSMNASFFISLF